MPSRRHSAPIFLVSSFISGFSRIALEAVSGKIPCGRHVVGGGVNLREGWAPMVGRLAAAVARLWERGYVAVSNA